MIELTLTLLLVAIAAIGIVLTGVGGVVAGISKMVFLVAFCLTGLAMLGTWEAARADDQSLREASSE